MVNNILNINTDFIFYPFPLENKIGLNISNGNERKQYDTTNPKILGSWKLLVV